MDFTPPPPEAEPELDSWRPLDLGPYLRGEIERITPTIGIYRSDGMQLLYPGKEHTCIGEMEAGKSWFALACAAAELLAGHRVTYIHFEESDPSDTIERLQLLNVPAPIIFSMFRFIGPEQPATAYALAELIVEGMPSLVILDGVNEAMALHGQGIRDEDGAASYRRRLVKPFTRVGAAVLSLDHVVKSPEHRGRSPIGSVHKGNGITGSLIVLENAEPFGRGARGCSHVFVTKDRPGHLRQHGRPGKDAGKTYLGTLVVDDSQTFGPDFTMKFFAPTPDDNNATDGATTNQLADDVHAVILALEGQTVSSERSLFAEIRKAGHTVREARVRNTLDDLIAAGRLVEVTGKRGAKGYKATPTAAQDPTPGDPQ